MSSQIQLINGLGGAVGCDLRRTQNQLLFVEFNGKLSRLNLYRTATTVSSGTAILKGTWTFDLDTGIEGGTGSTFDIWWEQQTAVLRRMTPLNSAMPTIFRALSCRPRETGSSATFAVKGLSEANGEAACGRSCASPIPCIFPVS